MVVGITGGIACGKSTVCKKFADLGWEVVSTDSLVHQLLQDDDEVIEIPMSGKMKKPKKKKKKKKKTKSYFKGGIVSLRGR